MLSLIKKVEKIVIVIGALSIAFVLSLILVYNTLISTDWYEQVITSRVPYIMYVIYIVIVFILIHLYPIFKRIDNKVFLVTLLLTFFIAGLYLVFNADTYLRPSDQISVWQAAQNINAGRYTDFKKGAYLNIYPFQIGIVTFERLVAIFSKNITFLYFLNLIFNCLGIVLLWLITKQFYSNRAIQNITILLSVLFVPFLFNTLFIYGNVYGYTFMLAAVYCQIKVFKTDRERKWSWLLGVLVFSALSYLTKTNFEIAIIALCLVNLIGAVKKPKNLIVALLIIMVIPSTNLILEKSYSLLIGKEFTLGAGVPKSAYLVMGISEKNGKVGWYNAYTNYLLEANDYNTTRADKIARKKLRERLNYLDKHRNHAAKILVKKEISTWTDSTYQSIWNGPLPTWSGKVNTHLMKVIYVKDGKSRLYKFIRYGSMMVVWTILLFSLIGVMKKIYTVDVNDNQYLLFAMLFFVGGFIFHTFWETKAQYVYQYTASLIPIASAGLNLFLSSMWRKISILKLNVSKNLFNR